MGQVSIRYIAHVVRCHSDGKGIPDEIVIFPTPESDGEAARQAQKVAANDPRRCWQKGPTKLVGLQKETTVVTVTPVPIGGKS